MNIPNLEAEYKFYLMIMGLDESKMPPDQRQEIKRAFYGGCAQMFIIFKDTSLKGTDKDLIDMVYSLSEQITSFLESEVKKEQEKRN